MRFTSRLHVGPGPTPGFPIHGRYRAQGHCARVWLVVALCVLPATADAQRKAGFSDGLLAFVAAVEGEHGGTRTQIDAALKQMTDGLASWDARLGELERQTASALKDADPSNSAGMRTSLGAAYLERGRIDDALRELTFATQSDPRQPTPWLMLGLAHELARHNGPARDAYLAALAAAPENAVAAYHVARLASGSTDAATALRVLLNSHEQLIAGRVTGVRTPFVDTSLLEERRTVAPVFLPAAYAPIAALLSERRFDAALAQLRAGLPKDPLYNDPALTSTAVSDITRALERGDTATALALTASPTVPETSSEWHRIRGLVFRAAARTDDAIRELETAVRIGPWNERAYLELASVMIAGSDLERAERVLHDGHRQLPDSVAIAWLQTRIYFALGRDVDVPDWLQETLRIGPIAGASAIWSSVGRMYLRGLHVEPAEAAFRRSVSLNPNSAQAHWDLAEFLRSQDRTDDALAEYVAVLLIEPAHLQAHTSIGQMHLAAERYREASVALAYAVSRQPDLSDARYALATALLRLGHTDDAQRELDAFKELQARNTAAVRASYQVIRLKLDAFEREDAGALDEAIALKRRVVEAQPDVADNYLSLADSLVKAGQWQSAAGYLERAASLGAPPAVYQRIAHVYQQMGRPQESAAATRKYELALQQLLRTQGGMR